MKRPIWFVVPFGVGLIVLSTAILGSFKSDRCLKMAAGLQGGDSYFFAEKIKNLVEKYSEGDKKVCITLIKDPTPQGTEENLEKLEKNEAQLATAQADILVMRDFPNIQLGNQKTVRVDSLVLLEQAEVVSLLFPDMYQLVVRDDSSNIKSVSDLENKRIALPPKKGGQIKSFAFLMQHYGLITKEKNLVTMIEVGEKDTDLKKALCDDKTVDAVFFVRAIGNQNIRELLKDRECKARLVSIDQAAAIKIQNPYLEEVEIPEGAYQGGKNPIPNDGPDNVPDYQKQKVKTLSVQRLLLARKDVSPKEIQALTQILYEHQQELVKEFPLAANISPPNKFKGVGLPIHEGAQAYYDREKPSWLEENSGTIQVLQGILGLAIPVISGILLWLKQREQARKNKADDYIREVTALMDASECVHGVAEYLRAYNSNNTKQLKKFSEVIIEKTAKILIEKKSAEIDRSQNLISSDSLKSFSKTLRKVVNAIEKIPEQATEELLHTISERATELWDGYRQKRLQNRWLPFVSNWQTKSFELISVDNQKTQTATLKSNLDATLRNALAPKDTRQTLSEESQFEQFLETEHLEIRRDLDSIFKRAVNALVEERISQESFQSFRVVWQIATGDADRIPM
ncbi:TAXI family TRAP transporter solute-binding subunit [Scytonema sp. UIC 10036]|uniref:TAXI family TRAP transporter solute-binding subunit n=1 Tax=Scytonema sp. UIC 10036 TaxID=2304196 RepID=UPI00140F5E9F|nr:TAXI family TRAP transporter solute-binding subunit [Scytonema sp. UIC 10036]